MKKLLTFFAMALLVLGCVKPFDDSGLKAEIEGIKARLNDLEVNVASIQSTLGDGKFVQKVEKYVDPDTGRTTGVTVTYTTGEVVHFSIEPVNPAAGPVLSVMKNGAGELCWAIDGVIVQKDGKDVTVYEKPEFSVGADGHLYVTVNGETIDLGNVKGDKGEDGTVPVQDGIIKGLEVTDEAVIITYDNGTVAIPLATAFELVIEKTDYLVTSTDPIDVAYTVKNKTEKTVVDVYHGNDFKTEVQADKIVVTPKTAGAEGQMLVFADSKSGLTSIVKLNFEGETFEITDSPADPDNHIDYLVEAEGGTVEANAVSNLSFEVQPQAEWIHFVKTRAQSYVIELSVDENTKTEVRTGTVNIVKAGTETVVQTITIGQKAGSASDGYENLGKKGTANCYLVYFAGSYKFKTVKGNSAESVGEVAKAVVIWETNNTTTAPEAGSIIAQAEYEDGFIFFSTPETLVPGNALIAAVDASDVILWSWHIWIPKTTVTTADAGFAGTYALMDRNLGALEVASSDKTKESEGLFYQWGRKDPLLSKKLSAVPADVVGKSVDAAPTDIATATQNPTVFYYNEGKDWLAVPDANLWDNAGSKTQYDPCPPGYKVPAYNAELDLWKKLDNDVFPTLWSYDETAGYCQFTAGTVTFPLCGYINGGGQSLSGYGKRALVWSSTAKSETHGSGMFIRENKYYSDGNHKACGASVRCIKTDDTPDVPPTPPTPPADPTTDLSKDASANSYLVTAAGDYKFKAVKGNSDETVGTVAKAEILWETDNTDTAPEVNAIIAKVGFEDGYITFSTPETLKPGNAVIAARDASDVILWSWHIWIPQTTVAIWDSEAFCGAKMMDRNLGALTATNAEGDVDILSIGLYYQWGRKDPFPGATSFEKYPSGAKQAGTEWSKHGELISTEYSIQHPTEYAYVPEVDEGVWNADDPKDLWNTEDNKKTIYDPCPPGYRVPLYDSSLPMWAGSDEGFTFEDGGFRFKYGDFLFTVAGYIDCWGGSYAYSNLRTHVWASTWYDDKRSTCLYMRLDKSSKYYSQKFHKAKAGSVRCVVE